MNVTDSQKLRDQNALLAKLHAEGLPKNQLKAKYRDGKEPRSHTHTCNHGGGYGKAARRNGVHGNGSSRVTVKGLKAVDRGIGPWPVK